MRAIDILRTFFTQEKDLTAVYLYGRYGTGPSFADTDIEVGLLFPSTADEDEIREYMEHLSNVNPLGDEPGILMPFALNTHVLPVVYEVMTGGTVLVDHEPAARETFYVQMQTKLDKERSQILEDAKDLYSRWNDLMKDEKRRVVENITEKIVIGKEEVEITLLYLPASENVANSQRNLTDSWRPPA